MIRIVATAGFAMFSMFFGSGNLVFPILTGMLSGEHFGWASIGLLITGVLVPFLGLLAIIYYDGDKVKFFGSLGRIPSFMLILSMLALMGPFGVLPRCIIVAYGGIHLIFNQFVFWQFSLIFCGFTMMLAWRQSSIITVIGNYLTPFFIIAIIILIIAGLCHPQYVPSQGQTMHGGLVTGIKQGYQTMDLLAAFFFSAAIINFIKSKVLSPNCLLNTMQTSTTHETENALNQQMVENGGVARLSLKAAIMGACLLAIIYIGLVYLGAKFSTQLRSIEAESLIVEIGRLTLGNGAYPIVALIIFLACLTTATILVELFSDFLHHNCANGRLQRPFFLFVTVGISFIVSLMGFVELARWINACLTVIYPALIAYSLAAISNHKYAGYIKRPNYYFWATLGLCLAYEFLGINILLK